MSKLVCRLLMLLLSFSSFTFADSYALQPDSLVQKGVSQGTISEHTWNDSKVFPKLTFKYWVYVPAQYDKTKIACLTVFQNGRAYLDPEGAVRATTVFDNLIHKNEMPVTIALFVEPGKVKLTSEKKIPSVIGKTLKAHIYVEDFTFTFKEKGVVDVIVDIEGNIENFVGTYTQEGMAVQARFGHNEIIDCVFDGETLTAYAPEVILRDQFDDTSDRYSQFVINEILPQISKQYNLIDDPKGRVLCGYQSGATCSFTMAWHRPDMFLKVISHSGAYFDIKGAHNYPRMIRHADMEENGMRIYLQNGSGEDNYFGDWYLSNLQMAASLKFANSDHKFVDSKAKGLAHAGATFPDALRWIWRDYPGVKGWEQYETLEEDDDEGDDEEEDHGDEHDED